MTRDTRKVASIKCGGCTHGIAKQLHQNLLNSRPRKNLNYKTPTKLLLYPNMAHSKLNIPEEVVTELGAVRYPMITKENDLLTKAKSYATSVLGKSSVFLGDTKSEF